jgi:hypothetical protein
MHSEAAFQPAQEKPNPEIKNVPIEDLELPIENILVQIKDKIKQGYYTTIVGDDASGRIPALILKGVFDKLSEKYQFESPELYFLAGGDSEMKDLGKQKKVALVKKFIIDHSLNQGNVLLVTEHIRRGASLHDVDQAFRESGCNYEIASVTVDLHSPDEISKNISGAIIPGLYEDPPKIWGKTGLSGVGKNAKQLHSYPKRRDFATPEGKQALQSSINSAREDVQVMVNRIVENIES